MPITLASLKAALDAQKTETERRAIERAVVTTAFELVAPAGDWKGPINKVLNVDHCDFSPDLLGYAIGYFTATEATFTLYDEGTVRMMRVKAAGYRAGHAN